MKFTRLLGWFVDLGDLVLSWGFLLYVIGCVIGAWVVR